DPGRRRAYADALTRVHRKPGPWVYWGYRPAPRPANTADWQRTAVIGEALDRALADPDRSVRLFGLRRVQRGRGPGPIHTLSDWLREERGEEAVAAILEAFPDAPASEVRGPLRAVIQNKQYGTGNRLRAVQLLAAGLDDANASVLLDLARGLEDGP